MNPDLAPRCKTCRETQMGTAFRGPCMTCRPNIARRTETKHAKARNQSDMDARGFTETRIPFIDWKNT